MQERALISGSQGEVELKPIEVELSDVKRTARILLLLPPSIALGVTIAYLSIELKLSTLRFQSDKNFQGFTVDTRSHSECHVGHHPNSTDPKNYPTTLHLYCYDLTKFP